LPYFYFAKGLAEYRSGRLENTIGSWGEIRALRLDGGL
jgi:hypothetical protein